MVPFLLVGISLIFSSCAETSQPQTEKQYNYLNVPEGFPPIPYPEDNPITQEKIELGRKLFYDNIVSADRSIKSCSHCKKQSNAFSDPRKVSRGFNDNPEFRNATPMVNLAYREEFFWDGSVQSLEEQVYESITRPVTFNMDTNKLKQRLLGDPQYPELFRRAFGEESEPSAFLVSKAIATFVRTMVSGNSPYDQYVNGDSSALNESEKRGMDLFFSERTNCASCHSGFMFTDEKYHNTGLESHYFDHGRYYVTGNIYDKGKFMTPTLRNVEVSGPYMHNGELESLEEVIEHYNSGGSQFINKDTIIKPLKLSEQQQEDLVNFLKALTDEEFLDNPKYKNPDF